MIYFVSLIIISEFDPWQVPYTCYFYCINLSSVNISANQDLPRIPET